ncbi:hypothetical protein lacNasYZ03_11780 [Lactobacillus nasalidis]|uniref:Uncharacterized protein n=1 Tax=Lactobacillus nasalidis TaxID=2797258 RepID=A0ABQ3W7I3_9LACO|nr:hypothetical protein [Lactobacillus nasalidis]GHV97902.1 hypothetical protein lacNasYZ01_10840 [Lactobacillus nasalidis]GHW00132.1 hypothetical protein lacNasYZ02_15610 [Lactobacillus nasalidis]GHW01491.1 hypothetical protein lacNasYZ03_11780 [Lactobacillus nasalidis]
MIIYIANDSYQRDEEKHSILAMTASLEGRNQETGEYINGYVRLTQSDLADGVTFEKMTYDEKLAACKKKMIAWLSADTSTTSSTSSN